MNVKYNLAVNTVNAALKVYAHCLPKTVKHKFPEFVKGRVGLVRKIAAEMNGDESDAPVVWFHAASFGEYAIARPLIAQIRAHGEARVVLTFFSPSGYRPLKDNHPGVDHVFYLPLDTRSNVRGFLEAIKPKVAVFLVSEYWPNILQELKFRSVPTFLVSAIIRNDAPFFRRYGKIFRKALSSYKRFFVLDKNSRENLKSLGCYNVTLSGDPLFDNASQLAHTPWNDPVLDRFTNQRTEQVFMAGSISDARDLEMVRFTLERHPQLKSIIAPHDISPKALSEVKNSLGEEAALLSELSETGNIDGVRHIIVDCMGKLIYMYRYATMAYVGGGFTPFLHSVIEATVYGIPVSFGPRIERKVTPRQLMELGIGAMVQTPQELNEWVDTLTPEKLEQTRSIADSYVSRNLGSTRQIVKTIEKELWPRK
ncbi:MAG: 3-deoxy-D-manno-octulosonic acid transferase [Firmicutes bacterium]|nr:3-deoxy-D-manno-octulosonic acid transferase [Bacillota bacterium]MCM1401677.1 3-deoxy-D-manno-octulosonic acid transferase [Bacteroides sp.]MCM1477546.1 3-deoxy-D-manno-octulosonic acid transferase [Bacteroides sp.]